jgi:uncharacterized protein
MKKTLQLSIAPEIALNETELTEFIRSKFKLNTTDKILLSFQKQSIDARSKNIKVNLDLIVYINEEPETQLNYKRYYQNVQNKPSVLIIGGGPAGTFAALRLIELGLKPIILERGKDVRSRRRDLALINKNHIVDPDSNYCFGEGGAGTYSDGKLYTRSKKRGDIRRILEILVAHGATDKILVDAHPHIGTNKLPQVVAAMRDSIINAGGEFIFETQVCDLLVGSNKIQGVVTKNGQEYLSKNIILATGHSARDIFELLHNKNIQIESKSFAMGVRIEHQQNFVDQRQYSRTERGLLPPASYSLVAQTNYKGIQRGVFSFCMCPGGFIVPASTARGELVVNGMSPSRRDSKFANSGIVVAMNEPDWKEFKDYGDLAALELQKSVEQNAWKSVVKLKFGKDNFDVDSQYAPAQRIPDFLNKRISKVLNDTSYQPGLIPMDFNEFLPDFISQPLNQGIKQFGKKMKKYSDNGGQLIGIESRTSSPVRIPRDKISLEHPTTKGLFPCGEGAGYAGGIVSAAMDGERCAEAVFEKMFSNKS